MLALFALAMPACDKEEGLKIKSISPKSGPPDGAGAVTIHGNGFESGGAQGVTVYFGEKKARFLRFDGDTKMVVVPPAGDEGQVVDVMVVFGDAREHRFPAAYKYIDPKAGFDVNALAGDKGEEE